MYYYIIIGVLMVSILLILIMFKLREDKLIEQIERDEFTNLYNKTASEKKINKMINKPDMGALFLIDIDDFKSINDTYGHVVGDKKLLNLAVSLTECFKDRPTVVGRAGGDEFIIFFTYDDFSEVKVKADALMDIMKEDNINMTFSMGIATERVEDDYNSMLERADKLLYEVKRSGKNNYKVDVDK